MCKVVLNEAFIYSYGYVLAIAIFRDNCVWRTYWLLREELLDSASRGTVLRVAFGQAIHIKILVILGNLKPAK